MKPDLTTDLRQRIEHARQVQQESREQRKRAEELIQQAEQLFTRIEWSQATPECEQQAASINETPRYHSLTVENGTPHGKQEAVFLREFDNPGTEDN